MNISNNSVASDVINSNIKNYSNNLNNISQDVATKNISQTQNAGEINLQELNVGDVFSGEILDINNNSVTILLKDNSVINALLKEALSLNIGEKLVFQIKDKNDGTVFIKPLQQDLVSKELVSKSLNAAGLTVNDKNSMIVSSLINSGQPIDRQTIINYIKLTNEFGMENINKLIDMNKQGISISQENLEVFERYQNSNHQLTNDVNNFSKGFGNYIENLITQGMSEKEVTGLNDFLKQVSNIISEKNIETQVNKQAVISDISENENSDSQTMADNKLAGSPSDKALNTILDDNIGKNVNVKDDLSIIGKSVNEHSITKFSQIIKDIENLISKRNQAEMGINITENFNEENINKLNINNEINNQEFNKEIALLKDKIDKFIKEQFILKLESDIKDDASIKETIEKNYEKLFKLTELVKDVIPDDKGSVFKESATQLNNNLSFMNELNHLESYVQIPVKMSEQDANGELYVYTKQKNERKDGDELTAFLHLDMESLGATDVNVKLKENGVEIVFTLDNEISEKLVLEHIDELSQRLEKKGYSSKIYAKTVEKESKEEFNPLSPIKGENERSASIKRYTFDIRT